MALKPIPKPALIGIAATAAVAAFGGYVWMREHRPPVLEIFIFALKSGQATLIRTPDDRRMLIDGGSNSEIIRKISSVLPFYSRRIDAIVATEADGKKASGLIDVIERYQVDRMYIPAMTPESIGISTSTDPAYQAFLEAASRKGIEPVRIESGDLMALDAENSLRIEAVFPTDSASFEYSKASVPQILLSISYEKHSVLILNDASMKIQRHIASSTGEADVVFFSHTASSVNVSRELISAARPEYLVYSKAVTKSSSKKSGTSSGKTVPDPLAGILTENRFNLKEVDAVHITIDAESISVSGGP